MNSLLLLIVICLIAAIVVFLVLKQRRLNVQQYDISEDIARQNPLFPEVNEKDQFHEEKKL